MYSESVLIRIDGIHPVPKGNSGRIVRAGKFPRLIPSKRAMDCQKILTPELAKHVRGAPFEGPVRRNVVFTLAISPSWPKWKKAAAADLRFLPAGGGRTPDCGNLLKLLDDCLEASGLIFNDSQIIGGESWKVYGPTPGYLICLEPLAQADRTESGRPLAGWFDGLDAPPLSLP